MMINQSGKGGVTFSDSVSQAMTADAAGQFSILVGANAIGGYCAWYGGDC
jgi:hypothetical protein